MEDHGNYIKLLDEQFFNDGYKLCDTFLFAGFTKENLFAAQKQLYKVIDELNNEFLSLASKEGKPSACKMGCSYCCHQTVLATPYELFFLAQFVKNKFSGQQLDTIVQRASAKASVTSKLPLEKRLRHKQPCPLLHPEQGFCRAYQARPMACRIYLSSDVKSCQADLETPNDDSIFPQLYDMPLHAGRMMNEGFHARLRLNRKDNLQAFENTIEEGLLTALNDKAIDEWIVGKSVFKKIS